MNQPVDVTGLRVRNTTGIKPELCVSHKEAIWLSWKRKSYGTLLWTNRPFLGRYLCCLKSRRIDAILYSTPFRSMPKLILDFDCQCVIRVWDVLIIVRGSSLSVCCVTKNDVALLNISIAGTHSLNDVMTTFSCKQIFTKYQGEKNFTLVARMHNNNPILY